MTTVSRLDDLPDDELLTLVANHYRTDLVFAREALPVLAARLRAARDRSLREAAAVLTQVAELTFDKAHDLGRDLQGPGRNSIVSSLSNTGKIYLAAAAAVRSLARPAPAPVLPVRGISERPEAPAAPSPPRPAPAPREWRPDDRAIDANGRPGSVRQSEPYGIYFLPDGGTIGYWTDADSLRTNYPFCPSCGSDDPDTREKVTDAAGEIDCFHGWHDGVAP